MNTKKALAIVKSRVGCPKEDDWELMEAAEHLAEVVDRIKKFCDNNSEVWPFSVITEQFLAHVTEPAKV